MIAAPFALIRSPGHIYVLIANVNNMYVLVKYILYIIYLSVSVSGLGCHVGSTYAGAFGYADDIALIAPSLSSL